MTLPACQQQLLAGEKKGLFRLCRGGERYDFTGPPAAAAGGRKKGSPLPPYGGERYEIHGTILAVLAPKSEVLRPCKGNPEESPDTSCSEPAKFLK